MGETENHNLKLLRASFSDEEWAYLVSLPEFNNLLQTANKTLDDFENLSLIGARLLIDMEEHNPLFLRPPHPKYRK